MVLFNEHHVWLNWSLSHALGGVQIRVPAADASEAAEILRRLGNGEYLVALSEHGSLAGDEPRDIDRGSSALRWAAEVGLAIFMLATCSAIFPPRKWRARRSAGPASIMVSNEEPDS